MRIGFFGHDAHDAAIAKRVRGFKRDGHEVQGFMMRRGPDAPHEWDNIDLGLSHDGRLWHRYKMVRRAVRQLKKSPEALEACDLIYARNPDMLLCAVRTLQALKLEKPIVYECLDVHKLLARDNFRAFCARQVERRLMKKTALTVISSPAFYDNYFARHHKGMNHFLLENRLINPEILPAPIKTPPSSLLRIGWFGMLRCARSLSLLKQIAEQFPGQVEIIIHGKISKHAVGDLEGKIKSLANINYHGSYKAPDDLAKIYGSVDVVWAGDFSQAGLNSKWLLPNRIYEGGFYATPPIAPTACQTGKWVSEREIGFTLPEALEMSFPLLVQQLLENRAVIEEKSQRLAALDRDVFIEPKGALDEILRQALENHQQGR